jgi:uncharacterized BrkB/YihY/UPF0761 family membrane protein
VLELRGAVGIVGLVGLLWSASGVFTVLAYNVNRAWPGAEPRSFLKRRLLGFAMLGTLVLFLGLSLGSSAVLNLLPPNSIPTLATQPNTAQTHPVGQVGVFCVTLMM